MFDKPNVVIPLAASYNQRGVASGLSIINTIDQFKINSMYEPIKNSLTGKTMLYLVKRPGSGLGVSSYGTTGQVAYLIHPGAGLFGNFQASAWMYSTSGNDQRVSNSSGTTTVIVAAAGYKPTYVDKTSISGTDTVILQLSNGSVQTVWYSNAIATWTQITDGDFPAVKGKMEFMDGYAFAADNVIKAIYNSDINSLANWNPSNYITKQIQQDSLLGLMRLGKQIFAFGNETYEIFRNAGNATGSPLVTVPELQGYVSVSLGSGGTASGHYYANLRGKLYFNGSAKGQTSISTNYAAYMFDGQKVEKISTVAIDKILNLQGIYSVNTFTFSGKEAVAFSMSPVTDTTQRWLMYFPEWNEWFEWNSTVFSPVNNGGLCLGVGSNQHRVYSMFTGSNTYQDDGTDYTWKHQFQLPSDGNQRKFMPYMGLKGDTARSAQAISVEFSDDDYQTFSAARTIDMTSKEKMLTRCGSYKGARAVRLSHSGNTEVRLSNFLARIE